MKYSLLILAFALVAAPCLACTAPTEYPYDPTQYPSDLVIEGLATSTGRADGEPYAEIKVSDVFVGKYSAPSFRLKWWVGGGGMCDPPGPDVKVGQRVRIYLGKEATEFRPQGWVLAKQYPRSDAEIQKDQAIAQERVARQEKYFQAGSALSYNNPKEWLRIEDIPELRHSKFPVYLSFTVGPNGAIEECESGHVEPYQTLDIKACKVIEQRARLVPPKFPEEANGSFDMDPPDNESRTPAETHQKSLKQGAELPIVAILLLIALVVGGFSVWAFKRNRSSS